MFHCKDCGAVYTKEQINYRGHKLTKVRMGNPGLNNHMTCLNITCLGRLFYVDTAISDAILFIKDEFGLGTTYSCSGHPEVSPDVITNNLKYAHAYATDIMLDLRLSESDVEKIKEKYSEIIKSCEVTKNKVLQKPRIVFATHIEDKVEVRVDIADPNKAHDYYRLAIIASRLSETSVSEVSVRRDKRVYNYHHHATRYFLYKNLVDQDSELYKFLKYLSEGLHADDQKPILKLKQTDPNNKSIKISQDEEIESLRKMIKPAWI